MLNKSKRLEELREVVAKMRVVKYQDSWVFLFDEPETEARLRTNKILAVPLGIDPSDKKNANKKQAPFVLGPFATRYLAGM